MAEDIIIRYRAETDEFLKELNVLIDKQDQLADEAEKTAKSFDKSATNEVQAAKRRQQAIEAELKNIERLKQARARAFDPVLVDRFNRQISEGEKRIKSLTSAVDKAGKETVSTFNAAGSQIKNIGLGIAAGFGAAFSIDAIVQFSKASVNAFLDAEKNANKLKFAITSIGGESEEAFNRLIKQSNELQKITIFSDDAIQQAQAALSAFGLTADEIEALIPKLADFATVTGQDIVSATQQVGAGLEGAGREFKKYGIEVSATASRQENLNSIIQGFGKFAGAATEATNTLAGSLEQSKNRADDLQEAIGEKLAPAFVRAKLIVLEFFSALFGTDSKKKEFDALRNNLNGLVEDVDAVADAIVENGGAFSLFDELFNRKSLGDFETTLAQITQEILKQTNAAKGMIKTFEDVNTEGAKLASLQGKIDEAFKAGKLSADGYDTAVNILKESLKGLGSALIDYQNKQKKQAESDRIAAEQRLKEAEEAQKKLSERLQKEAEERRKLEAEAFEQFKANLIKEQDQLLNYLDETEKKLKERDALFEFEVRFKAATEGEDAALEFAREKLFKTYQEEIQSAELTSDTVEEANAKKQKAYEEYIANSEKLLGGFSIFEQNNAKNTSEVVQQTWIERNEEILRTSLDLFQQLSALSNTFTQQRIEDLNLQLEKVREVEEAQLTALEESKEKRLISEADYEKRSESIKQQRIASEKKIQAEISKQKRKQAIIDKTSALFEIALNTAIAIMKVFAEVGPIAGVPLASLTAALGAAQAATVLAQPIPAFAKGTKGKKGSGMALVGEQGAEMTFLPDGAKVLPAKQTKTYGEVFDAMFDNRFDSYIMKNYVAPALEQQRKKFEGYKQESFTKNIVNSMQYNGITTGDLLYANSKGTKIKNADEIAYAIAKALKTQSPDLWRM